MSGARFWQIVQYTATRAGYNGYQWHFGGVGLYTSADGSGTNQGTSNNTSASASRGGQTVQDLFTGTYIFADCDAGKIITVDVGEGNTIDVLSVSYQNAVGEQWAPSQVQVKWSQDGTEWTNAKIYDDNGGTSRQVITGIEQPPSDALPVNYLATRGRDRMRSKGISLGEKAIADGSFSFLTAKRDRLRTKGVSLEDAKPFVPPFNPESIDGLLAWVRADAFTDKGDGDLIAVWPDQSGNGNDLTGSASDRPTYKTGILNDLPALLFDGAYNNLMSSTIMGVKTIIVVAKYSGATFNDYDGLITGESSDIWFIGSNGGSSWYTDESPSIVRYRDGVSGSGDVTNAWHIFHGEHAAPHTMKIRAGCDRGMFRGWDGYVAEIVAYDSVLSETDRDRMTDYMKTKYGIV